MYGGGATRFSQVKLTSHAALQLFKTVFLESIIVLPSLGVQLETHRGFPLFSRPLFTGRRFIPLCTLQDIIINEGLHRWDVRYYLAFVNANHLDMIVLEVAYEVFIRSLIVHTHSLTLCRMCYPIMMFSYMYIDVFKFKYQAWLNPQAEKSHTSEGTELTNVIPVAYNNNILFYQCVIMLQVMSCTIYNLDSHIFFALIRAQQIVVPLVITFFSCAVSGVS